MEVQDHTALLLGRVWVQQSRGDVGRLMQGSRGWVCRVVPGALIGDGSPRWLLAVGQVALRGREVAVVLVLMGRGGAMVGAVVGVHMVVVAVVSMVMMVSIVVVMVVSNQTISSITLTPHWRAAAVAYGRVASLWHVVGMRSAAWWQLPGPHGGGGGRSGARAQVQHGLLRKTLPFGARAVVHFVPVIAVHVIWMKM